MPYFPKSPVCHICTSSCCYSNTTKINIDFTENLFTSFTTVTDSIFQSKIPWYLNYNDLGKLFDTAKQYANSNISQRYEVMELLVSLISRNSNEMQNYYRTFITEPDQVFTNPPNYVPLNSVYYSASNTLNKLAGNYMSKGLVSALVSKTENVERIESLLKQ